MKKFISLITTFLIILQPLGIAAADITYDAENTAKYVYNAVQNPTVSSIGGEWAVIGLARSGADIPSEYYEKYYNNAEKYLNDCGGMLSSRKYTEYSRVILALTAIGKDPRNVDGYNLTVPLGDFETVNAQGINGAIWALIALDSGKYEILENKDAEVQASRKMYVDCIVGEQKESGGWAFGNMEEEADLTAMAICALANYRSDSKAEQAIQKALNFLSEIQTENGGYASWGSENSESAAQVLTALCTLGISPEDARFVKNGKTVYDNLMSFSNEDGSFSHIKDGETNQMATEQALYALAALKRFNSKQSALYDMTDIAAVGDEPSVGLPNKNFDVKKTEIGAAVTFSDIENCSAAEKIEALTARKIINGMGDGKFEPYQNMTRAEFSAIVVRSLGLENRSKKIFDDVSEKDWFFGYVAAAFDYKIVLGISETEFNPNGLITKEEAAAMVCRAAKLCGADTERNAQQITDSLSEFTDYRTVSEWAKESMAFCIDTGILPADDAELEPSVFAVRAEIAEMIYNMLDMAKLL